MPRKKSAVAAVSIFIVTLFALTGFRIHCDLLQHRRDDALINAIKSGDNPHILAVLAAGANGEAQETDKSYTFGDALKERWKHLLTRRAPSAHVFKENNLPALLLLYQIAMGNADWKDDPGPNAAVVRALLDHGARVDDQIAENGFRALTYAALFSDAGTVRLLLERGANVDQRSRDGDTPLMCADAGVTQILLDHGANIEARDADNGTPLIWAVKWGSNAVPSLLKRGAAVSPRDNTGMNALDYAISDPGSEARKIEASLRQYGAKP